MWVCVWVCAGDRTTVLGFILASTSVFSSFWERGNSSGAAGEQVSLLAILVPHVLFICINNFRVERTTSGRRIKHIKVVILARWSALHTCYYLFMGPLCYDIITQRSHKYVFIVSFYGMFLCCWVCCFWKPLTQDDM